MLGDLAAIPIYRHKMAPLLRVFTLDRRRVSENSHSSSSFLLPVLLSSLVFFLLSSSVVLSSTLKASLSRISEKEDIKQDSSPQAVLGSRRLTGKTGSISFIFPLAQGPEIHCPLPVWQHGDLQGVKTSLPWPCPSPRTPEQAPGSAYPQV